MISSASPADGTRPVGDVFSTITAGFSLRKLRATYTGNCIKIRRSSDNTTQDIGFVGMVLDTASVLSFCGAGNGFIDTWYDQSGSGFNLTQATTASQPKIVSSGVLNTDNGKASILFDGSDDFLVGSTAANWKFMHYGSAASAFFVGRMGSVTDPEAGYFVFSTTGTTQKNGQYLFHDTRSSVPRDRVLVSVVGEDTATTAVVVNVQLAGSTPANVLIQASVITKPLDATAANRSEIATDGQTAQKNNASTGTAINSDPWTPLQIGTAKGAGGSNSSFLVGSVAELILYNTDKSSSRATIYTNQKAYYNTQFYNTTNNDAFLDMTNVDTLIGLSSTANGTLSVNAITKFGSNPTIPKTNGTWDYGYAMQGIVKVSTTYKMYYAAYSSDATQQVSTCYQTSSDLTTWTKPNLGLVTYGGNTNNNIIIANPVYTGGIFYETTSPVYSLLATSNSGAHVYFYTSADGTTFTLSKDLTSGDYEGFILSRRPFDNRWLAYNQTGVGSDARGITLLLSDTTDQTSTWTDKGTIFPTGGTTNQAYVIGVDYQFGMFYAFVYRYNSSTFRIFQMDFHTSRDGVNWTLKSAAYLSTSSNSGDWDYGMIYPGMHFVRSGNDWRYYYSGCNNLHNAGPFGFDVGYASIGYGRIGQVSGTGQLKTTLLTSGVSQNLLVNANGTGGSVQCELTDSTGAVIAGYERANFDSITSDVYDHAATWSSGTPIPNSTTFNVVFYVTSAILYNYEVV